ncbi:hypothetical protein [Sphingomonas sp.]|uniref:hypothetical protein n=1 Tax=Sphingomonas sp. TaxID=28214 RepID=UPI001EBED216|nr:hypothetical protein [Sphingomonas sp.]MBX3595191.1 hypothetical protein [Sphingomonas sp.]
MTMSRYPDLEQHCPLADRIETVIDGNLCRQCRTVVIDLDSVSEAERLRIMAGANGPPCVRYSIAGHAAVAALAAAIGATPLAAQDAPAPPRVDAAQESESTVIVGVMRRATPAGRARYERDARRAERRAAKKRREADKAQRGDPVRPRADPRSSR